MFTDRTLLSRLPLTTAESGLNRGCMHADSALCMGSVARDAALTSAERSRTRSCSRRTRRSRLGQPQRIVSWRLLPCLPHGAPQPHSKSCGTCTHSRNTGIYHTWGGRAACKQGARVSGAIRRVPLCLKESRMRRMKYAQKANLICASQQIRVGVRGDRESHDVGSACRQISLVTGRMERRYACCLRNDATKGVWK